MLIVFVPFAVGICGTVTVSVVPSERVIVPLLRRISPAMRGELIYIGVVVGVRYGVYGRGVDPLVIVAVFAIVVVTLQRIYLPFDGTTKLLL